MGKYGNVISMQEYVRERSAVSTKIVVAKYRPERLGLIELNIERDSAYKKRNELVQRWIKTLKENMQRLFKKNGAKGLIPFFELIKESFGTIPLLSVERRRDAEQIRREIGVPLAQYFNAKQKEYKKSMGMEMLESHILLLISLEIENLRA